MGSRLAEQAGAMGGRRGALDTRGHKAQWWVPGRNDIPPLSPKVKIAIAEKAAWTKEEERFFMDTNQW
jgi:hypothetical protein